MFITIAGIGIATLAATTILSGVLRRVVEPNMVTIVQSAKNTKSYGTNQEHGNVYWEIPSWVPVFGVTTISLPVSNFNITIPNYVAYDKDRVPFSVDVNAFFRIEDTNTAAKRVASFQELQHQLTILLQGAVRKVLASDKIDTIMLERSKFGDAFTKEVADQLKNWGVIHVKNVELLNIQDSNGSQVIENIMSKKKSFIEMESRKEVAKNNKEAELAEIEANREVELENQKAQQAIGERTADKEKAIGIAQQKSKQDIAVQAKTTREKEMEIVKVEQVKAAEIEKEKQVVKAEENRQTTIIRADGELENQKRQAEAVQVQGAAKAEAERLILLAPVEAQITLAKEIGENEGYQEYLVKLKQIDANQVVGVEQAKALTAADIKVIANTGNPVSGVNSVMDLFTPAGGTNLAGMVEGIAQSDVGQAVLSKLGVNLNNDKKSK